MRLLLGTNIHPAQGDAARRQSDALASWLELEDVVCVNLQFLDVAIQVEGFETRAVLRCDSVHATARQGVRKPIASEVFTALASLATEKGCAYFAFVNSDVRVQPLAVSLIARGDRDAYLFSRMDFDGLTGRDQEVQTAGIDGFALRADWWMRNRFRFRAYIIGESAWDNVYCAQILCHSRGLLLNRGTHLRHEQHAPLWKGSPFANYIQLLSALDATYFSLWSRYWHQLQALRAHGATESEELALQEEAFVWAPSLLARLLQRARAVKAHGRYQMQQRWGT
jgi:hypothetical protein